MLEQQAQGMTIFTFPETASCSSNLPQLGLLPRQEGRSDAAAAGPLAPRGLLGRTGTMAVSRVTPVPP